MFNNFSNNENKNAIDVLFKFNGAENYAQPVELTWQDTVYDLSGVQFWYAEQRKGVTVHHYTISDKMGLYSFKLALETENLTWKLESAKALHPERIELLAPASVAGVI